MSRKAQSHELTYDLIKRAVHGDQEAIEAYLLHYDAYISDIVNIPLHFFFTKSFKLLVLMYHSIVFV